MILNQFFKFLVQLVVPVVYTRDMPTTAQYKCHKDEEYKQDADIHYYNFLIHNSYV
jgi:hypothetical protein